MPQTGALLLTNGRRRNRASSMSSIMSRLKNRKHGGKRRHRASSKMRSHGKRIARSLPRNAKGRFMKRRNGFAVVRTNGKHKRRRNSFAVVKNSGFGALAVRANSGLASIGSFAGKVPVVGKFVVPAVVGATALTAVHFAMQYGLPLVMQYAPAVVTQNVLPWLAPVGYTVGGAIVATAIAKLPIPLVSPGTKKMVAVAAVIVGAGVDALRYWSSSSVPVAMTGPSYGEGLWQTVPFGSLSAGGRTYGESTDVAAIRADYTDARLTDVARCPEDMSPLEGQAAQMGASTWRRAFHPVKVTDRSGADLAFSRHAGREGHRWGWLISMIGFERFSKLAQMPAWQRISFIRQLRQRAAGLADQMIKRPELAGLILAQ